MTDFLVKRFIKNSTDVNDPAVRTAYGNLAGAVGIFCNVLLCAAKLAVGTLFGSISITADAVNNLSDASSSVITLVGFRLSAKPADDEHPYGHARIEYLAGLAVSVMILVIGVELARSSIGKILSPTAVEFSLVTVAVLLLSIGGGWLIARDSFLPLERITEAAGNISDGDDLSARLNLRRGPREMRRLARTFDGMFARLETSFLSKKQFTADASHELRTPVAVILAECDRAKRKAETKEDFLSSIGVIEQQGNKMNALIEQLLSLTRIQQGTEKYPLRLCDLSDFVDACCDEFVPADERGITLTTDITPDVEAAYNPSLLSRAMFNLMQNAYKYGAENGHIRVSLFRENGCAVISVKDDGPGIPRAEQEKIWQRFYRCDASRAEGGTGLGLSLVREIALVHRARAEVVSEPGQGSDFRIVLPPVKK